MCVLQRTEPLAEGGGMTATSSGCVFPNCFLNSSIQLHNCSQCPRQFHHMCLTRAPVSPYYSELEPPLSWCYMCIPATGRANVLPASTQHGSMQEVAESAVPMVVDSRDPCEHGFTIMADRRRPQARAFDFQVISVNPNLKPKL
jgi:hypothetical protein